MKWKERIENMKFDGVTEQDVDDANDWEYCPIGELLGIENNYVCGDELNFSEWLYKEEYVLYMIAVMFAHKIEGAKLFGYNSEVEGIYGEIEGYIERSEIEVPKIYLGDNDGSN